MNRARRSARFAGRGDQNLDGDKAAELQIAGFVDHAHAAFAELFEDFIMRNGGSNHAPESETAVPGWNSRNSTSVAQPLWIVKTARVDPGLELDAHHQLDLPRCFVHR